MSSDIAPHKRERDFSPEAQAGDSPEREAPAGFARRFKSGFQRWIIMIHRWLGVVACLFFTMWFASGIVLAYVRFPAMPIAERLDTLPPVDLASVSVSPGEAIDVLGMDRFPQSVRLEMSNDTPVYRITSWQGKHFAVAADSGEPVNGVTAEEALEIVRTHTNSPDATIRKADLRSDQWTVTGYYNKERPFHVIQLNDGKGSQYYVSVATGEIVLDTHRSERLWNWVGAIPHWLYFEFIRHDTGLWAWCIYIIAGAGIFVALSGIWVGIDRLRLRTRYADGTVSPFRGWMKWHHILGLLGGLFLALWIITGFMTMYPGGLLETRYITQSEYEAYAGDVSTGTGFDSLAALSGLDAAGARRISFRRVGSDPVAILEDGQGSPRTLRLDTGQISPLTLAEIETAAQEIMPDQAIERIELLPDGDEYWHSGFYPKKTPIVRVRFSDPAESWFHIDPDTGEILGLVDKTSRVDRWTVVAIHDLDVKWLLENRPIWDFVLFFTTIPGLALSITALVIGWRRLQRTGLVPVGGPLAGTDPDTRIDPASRASREAILVCYASQTGASRKLAETTAQSLEQGGLAVMIRDLAALSPAQIVQYRRALFLVSTAGDGDPPDNVLGFQRRHMRAAADFAGLSYAVLALGGHGHSAYCKFGLAFDDWLQASGAERMYPAICVDELDAPSLARWAGQIEALSGVATAFEPTHGPFQGWTLMDRKRLNPGSSGAPLYHLDFVPDGPLPDWQAGDIAQIALEPCDGEPGPENSALIREYSISSLPEDDALQLLVREMYHPDGRKGAGSSLLIDRLAPGEALSLRIRENPGFHPPLSSRKLILIGNGTGLAGLRAHLKRRALDGGAPAWLIYGERNAAYDRPCQAEIEAWLASGVLEKVDLIFSRDQSDKRYVQHALHDQADMVRDWVKSGASILVCGSLEGMAPGVHVALEEILGASLFETLAGEGRYRRDIY